MKKVIVIGGGASGIVAAICAARSGAEVTLLEKKEQIGKKLLATGNGRCNLLNDAQELTHFHSADSECMKAILGQVSASDILYFFSELGLLCKSRQGYYYPLSGQATSVVQRLSNGLEQAGVHVLRNQNVTGLQPAGKGYRVLTEQESYEADAVILAVGTMAGLSPKEKYNGTDLLQKMAVKKTSFQPALCALLSTEKVTRYWAGVRVDATISLCKNKKVLRQETGELMLTADGISGIPAFQVSYLYEPGCDAVLDFLPMMEEHQLYDFLLQQKMNDPEALLNHCLCGLLAPKLAECVTMEVYFRHHGLLPAKSYLCTMGDVSEAALQCIAHSIKNFLVQLSGTRGMTECQVCAGGVSLQEIDPTTCEVKKHPGLYITGELLDMNGDCGGYNLQWAWTTGMLAGRAAGGGV